VANEVCGCGFLIVAANAAYLAGVNGGTLGGMLAASAIAGGEALAFDEVGNLTPGADQFGTTAFYENVAGHAAVGCAFGAAAGGSCGSGAISAGAGAFAAPLIQQEFPNPQHDFGNLVGGAVASAVVGGTASVAGGGKFANGALTAAFGYLFNAAGHSLTGVSCNIEPQECDEENILEGGRGGGTDTVTEVNPGGGLFGPASDPEITLYHGTDAGSAADIVNNGFDMNKASELGGGDVFWTTTSKSDASWFAQSNPAGGDSAIVGITTTQSTINSLSGRGWLSIEGSVYKFDPKGLDMLYLNSQRFIAK
jgi:hypothetical protein